MLPSAVVPADFVAFHLQHNGGSFVECVLPASPLGPVVVAQFLACDGEHSYSLERAFAHLQAEGETQLLPFAEDPSGSMFVIGTASGDGAVYFWDQRHTDIDEGVADLRGLCGRIAPGHLT